MYVLAAPDTETHYTFHNIPAADVSAITDANNAVMNVATVAFPEAPIAGDRILVSDLTGTDSATYNGLYTITGVSTSGSNYVITTSRNTSAASANATNTVLATGVYVFENAYSVVGDRLYPADRCTWHTGPDPQGGYSVADAVFYNGNSATGTALTGDVRFGYIGKTGRFVETAR